MQTNSITEFEPRKERRRQELMEYLVHIERSRDIMRMGPEAFIQLCERIRATEVVKDAYSSTVEEQVSKFLHTIGHNAKNQSMDCSKNVQLSSSTGLTQTTKWTTNMDVILLNAMVDEAPRGSRIDGSWTTQGYNNIVLALHEVKRPTITKNSVKNRQKCLKGRWREVHELFSGLSGFDLMGELWSNDKATESGQRTTRLASREVHTKNLSFNFSIDGIFINEETKMLKGKGKSRRNDDEVPMIPLQRREGVLDYSRYFQTKCQMVAFEENFHGRPDIPQKTWGLDELANLKYDGLLLTPGTIHEDIHFDRQQALLTMTREEVHGQNIRNVGSLTMNDRLLHYIWVHMLCPRGRNFSQLVHEDIFMLRCLKRNVMIN
ncbi:hypothetical protein PHAVU_007G097400 [Phaseolus vulgaris]|uniref:Uncharacterized protein n=1 Tax=Phaseolus vulgaris TaxID=3885 RepID=V7BD14_PHAVU|nr:hypothetical protein PHAVU_007G097400g [Phaseolus vulgaris]ESW15732.1 hypothetical protein PHAVU_007G097400g [Phaseolus vulgaris]